MLLLRLTFRLPGQNYRFFQAYTIIMCKGAIIVNKFFSSTRQLIFSLRVPLIKTKARINKRPGFKEEML